MPDKYVNHNSQSKECNVQENSFIDEIYVNQHLCFQSAKEAELKSWKGNNVFEVIPYSNTQIRNVSQYDGYALLKKLVMIQNRRRA